MKVFDMFLRTSWKEHLRLTSPSQVTWQSLISIAPLALHVSESHGLGAAEIQKVLVESQTLNGTTMMLICQKMSGVNCKWTGRDKWQNMTKHLRTCSNSYSNIELDQKKTREQHRYTSCAEWNKLAFPTNYRSWTFNPTNSQAEHRFSPASILYQLLEELPETLNPSGISHTNAAMTLQTISCSICSHYDAPKNARTCLSTLETVNACSLAFPQTLDRNRANWHLTAASSSPNSCK